MRSAVVAVGSELLGTERLDTNSLVLTKLLEEYGLGLDRKSVVPDSRPAIVRELKYLLEDHDLVLMTGGLGPTEDDLTKDALAETLGIQMELDRSVLAVIEHRFQKRGMRMPKTNERQAMIFPGQRTIPNDRGSAPGFHLTVQHNGKQRDIWIFPGVPYELEGMIQSELEPWLKKQNRQSRHRRVVKVTGMSESGVDERLKPFYDKYTGEPITILASRGEIQIHLIADGSSDVASEKLMRMEQELRAIFSERIFGVDSDDMESVVGRLLSSRKETVATAESCTGGLLSSRITDVSGSSAYFLGGVVSYSRESKLYMLGVDPAIIDKHGEVSEQVAREMANGARRRFSTTYGIGITGIAGPTGGSEAKPVGTVHIAVASHRGIEHARHQLGGPREMIKFWSTQIALDMLRRQMASS